MADTTHTIGSTGIVKKLVDLGDGTYADAVATFTTGAMGTETVVAGAASTLGKTATLANADTFYVRVDTGDKPSGVVDWRVKSDQVHTVQPYKARSIVDSVTLTLASFADTNTIVLNGLTYTGESTATDATYAARKFSVAGDDTADAAALAALINADYAVVTAGTSVAATDKLVITTDEGVHNIVAAASPDYPAGKYGLSGTVATELASIVTAINHKANVTLASVTAGDTLTINGLIFTAHATTTTASAREFAINGTDSQDGDALVVCLNDATYGLGTGYTAVNASGVVSITRNSKAAAVPTITSSNGTRLAVKAAGGVPGVIAAATGFPGELSITPTWTEVLTVTEAGDQLTLTDIDCPGVKASSNLAVVTLVPGTPASTTEGELASVIKATAAANCTVSQAATLAGLMLDGAATTDAAANNTTSGTIYRQNVYGYEQCYLGITNKSGGAAATIVVGATVH